uniref:Uncharacterized protein n=2 Tax=Bactrocera dorsalis TaxID=27457 RepID=A0A034VTF4_BACDO
MENIKTTRRINRKRNKLRNTDKNGKFFKAEQKSNKISKAPQLKKETHHQSKQDLDSSELETLDLLITCSKLAEENILESQERYMNDLMSFFDSNQLVINGVEWVTIGAMKTVVRKKALCEMNWFGCPAIIVENLLEEVFGVKRLETLDIGTVDYNAISDIIDLMQQTTSLEIRDIIRAIRDKFAELERNRQRRELRKQLKNKYWRR